MYLVFSGILSAMDSVKSCHMTLRSYGIRCHGNVYLQVTSHPSLNIPPPPPNPYSPPTTLPNQASNINFNGIPQFAIHGYIQNRTEGFIKLVIWRCFQSWHCSFEVCTERLIMGFLYEGQEVQNCCGLLGYGPCSMVTEYKHFGGKYCLYLQIRRIICRRWRHYIPPKYSYPFIRLYGIMTKKTYHEDGGSVFFRNACTRLPDYTVL
jgi:hypothetical protein